MYGDRLHLNAKHAAFIISYPLNVHTYENDFVKLNWKCRQSLITSSFEKVDNQLRNHVSYSKIII